MKVSTQFLSLVSKCLILSVYLKVMCLNQGLWERAFIFFFVLFLLETEQQLFMNCLLWFCVRSHVIYLCHKLWYPQLDY